MLAEEPRRQAEDAAGAHRRGDDAEAGIEPLGADPAVAPATALSLVRRPALDDSRDRAVERHEEAAAIVGVARDARDVLGVDPGERGERPADRHLAQGWGRDERTRTGETR